MEEQSGGQVTGRAEFSGVGSDFNDHFADRVGRDTVFGASEESGGEDAVRDKLEECGFGISDLFDGQQPGFCDEEIA